MSTYERLEKIRGQVQRIKHKKQSELADKTTVIDSASNINSNMDSQDTKPRKTRCW